MCIHEKYPQAAFSVGLGDGAWRWQHLLLIHNLTSHRPGRFIHLPIMTRNEQNKVSLPTEKHYTRLTENNKEPENLIVTVPYLYLEISDAYLTANSPLAPFWHGPILPS